MNRFRLVVVIGLLAFAVSAQKPADPAAKPNLAGTWEYAGRDSPFKDRVLVITETDDEMNMVESYVFKNDPYTHNTTYYTDNRGEVNLKQFPGGGPPSQMISNTRWKKGKLSQLLRYAYIMESRGMRYKVTVDEEQIWSLSEDGETLTVNVRSKRDAPAIAPIPIPTTGKSVYRRKH